MAPGKGHKYQATNIRDVERKPRKKSKSLRQKIRDVRRLLQQPDIPATVRVAQERMLDLLQQSVKEKVEEDRERKLAKKYKMVKFFEKRKITRKYKACQSELKSCVDSERKKMESELQVLKDQWNYVIYFPHDTKYISLYPPVPYHNPAIVQKQEEILKMIKGKIESNGIPDASDRMFASPDNKKKLPHGRKDTTCLKMVATSKESTAVQIPSQNTVEDDDFFIDTSPGTSPELSPEKPCYGNAKNAPKSQFAVLGSASENRPVHKVKRLRSRHEVSATQWKAGTSSKNKDAHEHKDKDRYKNKDHKGEERGQRLAKKVKKRKTS